LRGRETGGGVTGKPAENPQHGSWLGTFGAECVFASEMLI
jgi:hypothetical protein